MALAEETSGIPATMLVGPTSYPMNNSGFGNGFGGDGWWIILLILLFAGGFNNGYGNNGGYGNASGLYPWMNQAQITTDGFANQMLNDNITSIREGVQGISTQLCNGFSDVQMSLANGFAGVEQGANARQMANMQSMFGIQSALQNCCCENRANIADLKYTVATENCADRAALSDGIRDVIASQTASTQRILDQLCQDKIDAKNDTINQLRQELIFARGQASQDVQTAELRANNATVANQLLAEMRSCPIPAQPVYGNTPIFSCSGNGCGCTGNF